MTMRPSSRDPVAPVQKAATDLSGERLDQGLDSLGKRADSEKLTIGGAAPDPASPAARLQRAAERAKDEGDLTQAEKFEKAARVLGCDEDDEPLRGVLQKLAKPKN